MNVAFSRSKDILIVFANINYLQERLPATSILRNLIVDLQKRGKVIDIKEIIKLGPFQLSNRPKLSPSVKIKLKDDEAGIFEEHSFEKTFEKDLKKQKNLSLSFQHFVQKKNSVLEIY